MRLFLDRRVLSWALYDFANSAFATTVLSVVFNVYFVKVVCAGGVPLAGGRIPGEAFWGYSLAASTFLVFLLAPVLGAMADESGRRKKFLFFFFALGVSFTGLLALCGAGDYWMAALFFIAANVGFVSGNAFYNALLKEVSTPLTVGRISGFGWALGYAGGGMLLALNLAMISRSEWFHIPAGNHAPVRASIFSVSIWWALFAFPLFAWVRESPGAIPALPGRASLRGAVHDVVQTFRKIREHREVFKFLAANLVYNDGIETVIVMASIFGAKELGMSEQNLILCFLMIQAVAFLGALAFGHLADRAGHKVCINATLCVYVAVCVYGAFVRAPSEFWILGVFIGLVLGGSQAASRSLLSVLTPPGHAAQFFGFFALTGKLATAVGPLCFALVSQFFSLRAAVGSLSVFFLAGLGLMAFVREPARLGERGALKLLV